MILFSWTPLWNADVRNRPLLIHCKRGKVKSAYPPSSSSSSYSYSSWLMESIYLILDLSTCPASNWLCCWMPKKTPALVSHFNFWRVPALCCCKSKNFWSKVHRTIWRGEHEASVSSFVLKLRGLALLHQERLIVPLWRQARNKHISYVMEDLFCNTGMCRMTVYDLL